MTKVSNETTDTTKRAPRKRAVRRVVSKSETTPRRTRVAEKNTSTNFDSVPARKAPTRVPTSGQRSFVSKRGVATLAVMLLAFGSAAWIGFSDDGQIDVNAQISEANQRVNLATESTSADGSVEIPVQKPAPVAASSLRGRGVGTAKVGATEPAPTPPAETETASTSEAGAAEGESESTEVVNEDTPESSTAAGEETSEAESNPSETIQ